MKKLLGVVAVLLALQTFAAAQELSTGGNGPDPATITSLTYPYDGDYTSFQICGATNNAADFLVEINVPPLGDSASSAGSDRNGYYDPTLATSHCGVVHGLMPSVVGTVYQIEVATCSSSSGGSQGHLGCSRTSPNYSLAPGNNPGVFGCGLSGACTGANIGSAGPPASGSSFTWLPVPQVGPQYCYQGHECSVGISNQWITGTQSTAPAYIFVTGISVDGQSCGSMSNGVESCGTTGVKVQYVESNSESPSASTNNFDTRIYTGGAPYTGDYFNERGAYAFGPFSNFLYFYPLSASLCSGPTNLCHTLSVTMQATNNCPGGTCTAIDSPHTFTYSFSVLAQPSFTPQAPSSYPALPSLAPYWGYLAAYGRSISTCADCFGILNLLETVQEELNAPGKYFGNDNFSAGLSTGPFGLWNYDGARVMYGVADELNTVTTAFQNGHAYNLDDVFTDGTNVEVVTTAGTSQSSGTPNWAASCSNNPSGPEGCQTSTGTAVVTNVGNGSQTGIWNEVAERIYDQYSDWALVHVKYTVDEEWNIFTDGMAEHAYRNHATVNSASEETRAAESFLCPFFAPSGTWTCTNQQIVYDGVGAETGTLRLREYGMQALYNYERMASASLVVNGVNELTRRRDAQLNDISRIAAPYSVWDGVNFTYAGGAGYATFDIGLLAEARIHDWIVQGALGQTQDTTTPVELGKLLDWAYSNEFNLAGDYGMPYVPYMVPYGSELADWSQAELDMLVASAYAWDGACTANAPLPTSGVTPFAVADTMFSHAFPAGGGGSKEFTQLYKWARDYFGWRTGSLSCTDSSILPAHNPYWGSTTPSIEAYPQNSYPCSGSPCQPLLSYSATGTSITATWYNTKPAAAEVIKLDAGCVGSWALSYSCTPPGSGGNTCSQSFYGSDSLYSNTVTLNNVPAGTYCLGFGGTDSNGQTAASAYDVINGAEHWQVTTSGPAQLTITTSSPLPTAEISQAYSLTFAASGGSGSGYSWSVSSGSPPAGTSLSSAGVLSGTPAAAGTVSFTVKVTDSASNVATALVSLTVATAPSIATSSLPAGTVGTTYTASLAGSGGVTPYLWSYTGTLPPGVSFNALTAALGGTPSAAGTYTPTFKLTDHYGAVASAALSITVTSNAQRRTFDFR